MISDLIVLGGLVALGLGGLFMIVGAIWTAVVTFGLIGAGVRIAATGAAVLAVMFVIEEVVIPKL